MELDRNIMQYNYSRYFYKSDYEYFFVFVDRGTAVTFTLYDIKKK